MYQFIGFLSAVSVLTGTFQMEKKCFAESNFAKKGMEITKKFIGEDCLSYGSAAIRALSSEEISIYGETAANTDCELFLSMYLDQKVENEYYTYKMWDFTEENASLLMRDIHILVPSGNFYRLSTYHAAKNGNRKEWTSITTKDLYIGNKR